MTEYKAERANLPSRYTLTMLMTAYKCLQKGHFGIATNYLLAARAMSDDIRDQGNLDDLLQMICNDTLTSLRIPIETLGRIAEILTCGGRIYDEFSEFLKPKEDESSTLKGWFEAIKKM